ncbi:MAG: glycosyltransferase family 2 protein [Proteobacteria bacterium]|nr:glycosyltransferase family 2 protein [Pseudomonadota bacterium]
MRLISVVTPCYNEEENVEHVYRQVKAVFAGMPDYRYEHIFIDNASTDKTVARIKALAAIDPNLKLIVNTRNFGHIRSPIHGMLQARGDAIVQMVSDLQEPPELIAKFIGAWQEGHKIVVAVKDSSQESKAMWLLRRAYYRLIHGLSDISLIQNFSGFGLYDRSVIEILRKLDDPYPYFRGLILEIGFPVAEVPYRQPKRARGITKNNFYTLYDIAMLGITSHSKVPLRIATMVGFALSAVSLLVAFGYLVAKLMYWDSFSLGTAPILIGIFFFASIQLFFIGILGEYIGAIHTQVLRRPLVVEKERVNFDEPSRGAEDS